MRAPRLLLIEPTPTATLAPLLERRPFPLLPVANRPLLDALFRALAEAGQPAAELFLHGDPRRVRRYVEDGHAWGLSLRCHSVREPAALLAEPLRAAAVLNGPGVVASLALPPEPLIRWLAAGANAPLLDADGQLVAARFDAEGELVGADAAETLPAGELLDTPAALWRLNQQLLATLDGRPRPERPLAPGVLVGNPARVAASARLTAPCLIGEHAWVDGGATIGPATLLGRGVAVGADSQLDGCLVLEESYLGPGSTLSRQIVDGNRVIDVDSGVCVYIDDPALFAARSRNVYRRTPTNFLLEGALAVAILLLAALPLALHALWCLLRGRAPWQRETRHLPDRRALDGSLLFKPVRLWTLSGESNPHWRRVPWLFAVLANRLPLLGTRLPLAEPTGSPALLDEVCGAVAELGGEAEAERWAFIVDAGPRLTLTRTLQWLRGAPSA